MDSTINIHMSWRDSRLTWDPSLYGDIRCRFHRAFLVAYTSYSLVSKFFMFLSNIRDIKAVATLALAR